jgi:putative tricarboxylic transport membrane protein
MIIFFTALLVGIVIGLIPGLGLFSALVILYPLLLSLSPSEILMFYAVMGGTSQFVGSITASLLGVAGEASSVPATKEGPLLFLRGKGPEAIGFMSIGSFLGTLLVSIILLLFIENLSSTVGLFYSNNLQTALFLLVMFIIILSGNNSMWLNLVYMIVGFMLANIGLQRYFVEPLTFGIPELGSGIPFIALALGLYSLPQVYKGLSEISSDNLKKLNSIKNSKFLETLKNFKTVWRSSLRGSLLGMFSGMVPGLTTILASNLSYAFEKFIRKKRNSYNEGGDMHCLISAETANNSGFLTSLLPLVIFGIPIIGSEAVVLNLIEKGGTAVGLNTLMADGIFENVIYYYILGGLISFFVAWQGAKYCILIYKIPKSIIAGVITFLSMFAVYLYGVDSTNHAFNFSCLFGFLFLGHLLKKTDTSVILFSFLIYPFLESSLYRFFIIHVS